MTVFQAQRISIPKSEEASLYDPIFLGPLAGCNAYVFETLLDSVKKYSTITEGVKHTAPKFIKCIRVILPSHRQVYVVKNLHKTPHYSCPTTILTDERLKEIDKMKTNGTSRQAHILCLYRFATSHRIPIYFYKSSECYFEREGGGHNDRENSSLVQFAVFNDNSQYDGCAKKDDVPAWSSIGTRLQKFIGVASVTKHFIGRVSQNKHISPLDESKPSKEWEFYQCIGQCFVDIDLANVDPDNIFPNKKKKTKDDEEDAPIDKNRGNVQASYGVCSASFDSYKTKSANYAPGEKRTPSAPTICKRQLETNIAELALEKLSGVYVDALGVLPKPNDVVVFGEDGTDKDLEYSYKERLEMFASKIGRRNGKNVLEMVTFGYYADATKDVLKRHVDKLNDPNPRTNLQVVVSQIVPNKNAKTGDAPLSRIFFAGCYKVQCHQYMLKSLVCQRLANDLKNFQRDQLPEWMYATPMELSSIPKIGKADFPDKYYYHLKHTDKTFYYSHFVDLVQTFADAFPNASIYHLIELHYLLCLAPSSIQSAKVIHKWIDGIDVVNKLSLEGTHLGFPTAHGSIVIPFLLALRELGGLAGGGMSRMQPSSVHYEVSRIYESLSRVCHLILDFNAKFNDPEYGRKKEKSALQLAEILRPFADASFGIGELLKSHLCLPMIASGIISAPPQLYDAAEFATTTTTYSRLKVRFGKKFDSSGKLIKGLSHVLNVTPRVCEELLCMYLTFKASVEKGKSIVLDEHAPPPRCRDVGRYNMKILCVQDGKMKYVTMPENKDGAGSHGMIQYHKYVQPMLGRLERSRSVLMEPDDSKCQHLPIWCRRNNTCIGPVVNEIVHLCDMAKVKKTDDRERYELENRTVRAKYGLLTGQSMEGYDLPMGPHLSIRMNAEDSSHPQQQKRQKKKRQRETVNQEETETEATTTTQQTHIPITRSSGRSTAKRKEGASTFDAKEEKRCKMLDFKFTKDDAVDLDSAISRPSIAEVDNFAMSPIGLDDDDFFDPSADKAEDRLLASTQPDVFSCSNVTLHRNFKCKHLKSSNCDVRMQQMDNYQVYRRIYDSNLADKEEGMQKYAFFQLYVGDASKASSMEIMDGPLFASSYAATTFCTLEIIVATKSRTTLKALMGEKGTITFSDAPTVDTMGTIYPHPFLIITETKPSQPTTQAIEIRVTYRWKENMRSCCYSI